MTDAPMPWFEALLLGTVQGLTEFLPISSSAHLRVVPALLGWSDPGVTYSAVIQLGSLIALVVYFWKDLLQLATGTLSALKKKDLDDVNVRLTAAIIIGTIPICVLGLVLKHALEAENGVFRSLVVIGCASIFMSALLAIAEKIGKRTREITQLGVKDGLLVGLGQAMALIPGCSRSGSTLTMALFLNMKREDAARFSFLLGMPAVLLSSLVELYKMLKDHMDPTGVTNLIVGFVSATVVSYIAIWWLIKYLSNHSTMVFIIYRLIFGVAVVALALMHKIS